MAIPVMHTGTKFSAQTMAASVAFPSSVSGDIVQTMADMIGLFFSSSTLPTISEAILTCNLASSGVVVDSLCTCFLVVSKASFIADTTWIFSGMSEGTTIGSQMLPYGGEAPLKAGVFLSCLTGG